MSWIRRVLAVAWLILMLPACAAERSPSIQPLDGTFIQLTNTNAAWPTEMWRALFDQFRAIGLRQVIIQWSQYDDVAFDTAPQDGAQPSALETILNLADAAEVSVLVGTVYDSQYWDRVTGDAATVERYLRRLTTSTRNLAVRIGPQLLTHRAFHGWYIAQEIDDSNWHDETKQAVLADYLANVATLLRTVTPNVPIALSGFAKGKMDALAYGRMWSRLLDAAGIELLLFQDGIGAGNLTLDELPVYLRPLRDATNDQRSELVLVTELFVTTSGAGSDSQRFSAIPADIERVRQQLEVAARYRVRTVAFSVPDYMWGRTSAAGGVLYDAYAKLFGL